MNSKVFDVRDRLAYSKYEIHETVSFGILLAIVGGFLDSYTFIARGGVFSNAQTGNIVLLGIYGAQGQWMHALEHLPPIIAFILGVIVTEIVKGNSPKMFIQEWGKAILILEIVVLFIAGLITKNNSDILVNTIISFVSSLQIASFRKLGDCPYSTTMTTGNLRTACEAAYAAVTKKDKKASERAKKLFTIIICFILGAFLGAILTILFGVKAIWLAALILCINVALFSIKKQNI
ncbi:YoaK family protein [Clostridium sp. C8-1-8]|uniref:YoaK family protein n=1 Tax=Clostridium sp. C8-1-8 TaxID=2698831 RepID=UPI00136B6A31|nr:YoaK family protein [Clostridium sp. C8-1-8]